MKVAVAGASGMVGTALVAELERDGHEVVRLVRNEAPPGGRTVRWDPAAGVVDAAGLEGLDAVVNLAGEPRANGRWTDEKKQRIFESRVGGMRLLAGALAGLARKPKVLVGASAVGYYGSRGDEPLHEESLPGLDFLADVCGVWESATVPAAEAGIRVVNTRFGMILSPRGGALKKMLPPFEMCVGGPIGSGAQWMSWVALPDAVRALRRAIDDDALRGPVNVTAPGVVANRDFAKTLGRVLRRPAALPLPAFAARAAFGEVADALLLASQRCEPRRLTERGFSFRWPDLEPALRAVLGL